MSEGAKALNESVSPFWLEAEPKAAFALAWTRKRIDSKNQLPDLDKCTRAEVGGILTDFQIDLELEELSTTKSHIIDFVVDEESLEEYEEGLNDLREQIDNISAQYDSLDRLIDHGLELDGQFSKELDFYNDIKAQRLLELNDITKECEDLAIALEAEKSQLFKLTNDEMRAFIRAGQKRENHNNDEQFEEYFSTNEDLNSYFKLFISKYPNYDCEDADILNCDDNLSLYLSTDIKKILETKENVENSMIKYINTKVELSKAKECLKFHLCHNENYYPSLRSDINYDMHTVKQSDYDKEVSNAVKSYVKQQISFVLYDELKMRNFDAENLYKEINIASTMVSSLQCCSEMLLNSIKKQDILKENIIIFFFSLVKLFMNDVDIVNTREQNIERLIIEAETKNSNEVDEFKYFKNNIYKIFKLTKDTKMSEAFDYLNSFLNSLKKSQQMILFNRCLDLLLECDKLYKSSLVAKKFIWDGAANQPNIINRKLECDIYEMEKHNSLDADQMKAVTGKFIQLRETYSCDLTLK